MQKDLALFLRIWDELVISESSPHAVLINHLVEKDITFDVDALGNILVQNSDPKQDLLYHIHVKKLTSIPLVTRHKESVEGDERLVDFIFYVFALSLLELGLPFSFFMTQEEGGGKALGEKCQKKDILSFASLESHFMVSQHSGEHQWLFRKIAQEIPSDRRGYHSYKIFFSASATETSFALLKLSLLVSDVSSVTLEAKGYSALVHIDRLRQKEFEQYVEQAPLRVEKLDITPSKKITRMDYESFLAFSALFPEILLLEITNRKILLHTRMCYVQERDLQKINLSLPFFMESLGFALEKEWHFAGCTQEKKKIDKFQQILGDKFKLQQSHDALRLGYALDLVTDSQGVAIGFKVDKKAELLAVSFSELLKFWNNLERTLIQGKKA
ncbi:MAG: hypothetical protein KBD63_00385 [Bacteriovoracaceae bacterium]|nr:hypothetical protein [Bacteriovoracaceae bacterium]